MTSGVHTSPPSPPMNLKRWIVQSERLFNSHHLGHSLAIEKQSFLAKGLGSQGALILSGKAHPQLFYPTLDTMVRQWVGEGGPNKEK